MIRFLVVTLHFVLASSSADDLENWIDPGIGQEHRAYTFQLVTTDGGGVGTGVLIHKDWILTATHVMPGAPQILRQDENGNLVVDDPSIFTVRIKDGGSKTKPKWGNILDPPIVEKEEGLWRKVVKIVSTDFPGQAMSYLGKDLALLQLEKTAEVPTENYFAPICLPDPNKPDLKADRSDQLYFAGFGRRMMAHCVTNDQGPERFKPCGRQLGCGHKDEVCKLDFKYKNKVHSECLTMDTPSSEDPVCQKLLRQIGKDDFQHRTFVFGKDGRLRTTCFPFRVNATTKGWCTTREPWIDENEEPKFDKGWGFCGEHIFQTMCGTPIIDVKDTTLHPVNMLDNKYCVDQLRYNLIKENLQVDESLYNDLDANGLLCVGQNRSYTLNDFSAFKMVNGRKFAEIPLTHQEVAVITAARNETVLSSVEGGPCFGDSGGPVIKFVEEKPVLIGIMSFLLWGICGSDSDPSFYDRVHKYYDFIFKHVPKNEVCFA